MVFPENIPEMEAELAKLSIPVSTLCDRAGIAQSTWGRWKNGSYQPTFRAWGGVASAYADLIAGSPQTPARAAQ